MSVLSAPPVIYCILGNLKEAPAHPRGLCYTQKGDNDMSERQEHKRRYIQRLEFIADFEKWLAQEPPMLPRFWRWKKWRDSRPKRWW